MKLVQLRKEDGVTLGVQTDSCIIDVREAVKATEGSRSATAPVTSLKELLIGGESAIETLRTWLREAEKANSIPSSAMLDEQQVSYAPCVTEPEKIICVGLNYRSHVAEWVFDETAVPTLFSKYSNALAGHGEPITYPAQTTQFDYEAELAVVIGREARNVSVDDAMSVIFGYANANDLSARDLQFKTTQWLLGKTGDGFCPIGPYLVTADEIADPQQLRIRCLVNGETLQDSNTANMIFPIAFLISFLSQHMTLRTGDVILTGTPEGVALGMPEGQQKWLKPGDEVIVEVEGLGQLTNRIISQSH